MTVDMTGLCNLMKFSVIFIKSLYYTIMLDCIFLLVLRGRGLTTAWLSQNTSASRDTLSCSRHQCLSIFQWYISSVTICCGVLIFLSPVKCAYRRHFLVGTLFRSFSGEQGREKTDMHACVRERLQRTNDHRINHPLQFTVFFVSLCSPALHFSLTG